MRSVQAPSPAEPRAAGDGAVRAELTERERAALTAAAVGPTAEAAGRRMGTSARTLRRAQASAVMRLEAVSLVHAVALAAAHGLLNVRHLETRTLPDWPGDLRSGMGRAEGMRDKFMRLRDEGVPVEVAAGQAGVLPATAWDWDQQWLEAGWEEDGG